MRELPAEAPPKPQNNAKPALTTQPTTNQPTPDRSAKPVLRNQLGVIRNGYHLTGHLLSCALFRQFWIPETGIRTGKAQSFLGGQRKYSILRSF
jgi:hypothetical protein